MDKKHIEELRAVVKILKSQYTVISDIAEAEQDEYDDQPEYWRDHTPESKKASEEIDTLRSVASDVEGSITELEAFIKKASI